MKLLEPLAIGTLTLPNRMVMPAMHTTLVEPDGSITDEVVAYYARRVAGEVGLVTLEATAVHRLGRKSLRYCMIDRDECIGGLKRLADCVHAGGAKFSVQLWHAGHAADPAVLGEQPVAPSPVPMPGRGDPPRELPESEIEDLAECYAEGARRAREAGSDAVEIHGGHGYLLAQFLSPLYNRRTDRYGGDLRNRARFSLEVVARVREKLGKGFPILFKLSASDHADGGITLDETRVVARWLQEAGVDALVVSSGGQVPPCWMVQPMMFDRGCLVPFAEAVKAVVDLPVGAIGRINDPALAERVLQEGRADFVNLGRALIADPDFPRKVREGRSAEIRACTACRLCVDGRTSGQPLRCMVNPEAGRELEWTGERAAAPKRVLVVGAGPGGLEAACTAARRGHRVTLCEQSPSLGGMLGPGSAPPSKAELRTLMAYYARELDRCGVEVRLGQRVTADLVEDLGPEVVVVAAGSVPVTPSIAGVERGNVLHARDVLARREVVGRTAVIVGGGSVGCETAEYLRDRGVEVTVLEMLEDFALDMEGETRRLFLDHLRSIGVKMVSNARVVGFSGTQVVYLDPDGREAAVTADTLVLAVGARPNTELLESLRSRGVPAIAVGDCAGVRKIQDAICEGALAGRGI